MLSRLYAALILSLLFHANAFAALPIGALDGAFDCRIVGWTCDADDYKRPVAVHFYEGSTFLAGLYAEVRREDAVGNACGGLSPPQGDVRNLQHGYEWTTPEQLRNGANHNISAYAIDPQNPNQNTFLGTFTYNCPATSTLAGFWDEGIANGKAQSDYNNLGCPGSSGISYGPCTFLPSGGDDDSWTPITTDSFGDKLTTEALFENCPTNSSSCHPSAGSSCASGANTQFEACNTYVSSGGYVSNNFWVVDANNELADSPYGPYLSPPNNACHDPMNPNNPMNPKVGPPNKALPITGNGMGLMQMWQTTHPIFLGKIINMRLDLEKCNPSPGALPFIAFAGDKNRGNNSKPVAVIRYPPDNVTRKKTITFTHTLQANRVWPSTHDIHLSFLLLEASWNGRKRLIFILLGGIVNPDPMELAKTTAATYREWNWPLVQSRYHPGAVIGFNPQPLLVEFKLATTATQSRTITLNLEDVFYQAINNNLWKHPDYPNDPGLDRYMLGDRPSQNTIIHVTGVSIVQEAGRVGSLPSWLYTTVHSLRTMSTQ